MATKGASLRLELPHLTVGHIQNGHNHVLHALLVTRTLSQLTNAINVDIQYTYNLQILAWSKLKLNLISTIMINQFDMKNLGKGQIIDLEEYQVQSDEEEDEPEELEMDNESKQMISIWNRDKLVNEAAKFKEDRSKFEHAKSIQHYDGQRKFQDLMANMRQLDGGRIFLENITSNPDGKKILQSSTVKFDKVGYIEGNEVPFESTLCQGRPDLVKLSDGPIIIGLLCALIELREGETANIIIHPSMAYGHLGCPPVIPEESYIFYNVKVHKVWHETDLEHVLREELDPEGPELDVAEKFDIVKKHKDIANQFLKDDLPREAIVRYKAAIRFLEGVDGNIILKSPEFRETLQLLHQNCAIGFNKLGHHKSASKFAKKALLIEPNNVKVHYQLAKARVALGDFDRALKYIDKALKLEPDNKVLIKFRFDLDQKQADIKKETDATFKRMAKAFC